MWKKEMAKPVTRGQETGIRTRLQVFESQRMVIDKMGIERMRPMELEGQATRI